MKFIQESGYLLSIIKNIKMTINSQCLLNFFLVNLMFLSSFLLSINTAHAIDAQQLSAVKKVIGAFKQNNRDVVSKMISYPLLRQIPLSPITNQAEFLKRYDEIFDQKILNIITQSNIHTDWDSIGWRGVILNNGIVALDPEGNIIEINYHSPREQALITGTNVSNNNNKAKGRRSLDKNIANNNKTLVEVTTPHLHIRVDSLEKNQGKLRYSAWSVNKNTSEAPDIVLDNGRVFTNNGRNQSYIFNNGTYQYQLNVKSLGTNSGPTGSLEVFKNGQFLKREVATKVIRR